MKKKQLEKVCNGVREGRQNEGDDSGQAAANVVRLPRDWLGPREELVPFGRQPTPRDAPDHPTSAADFWGEDAAAVHDALQAPADDPVEAPVETPPGPTVGVGAPARRRVLFASGLAIAAAVIAALASLGFGVHGSPSNPAAGARLDMAAVLSGSLSRMLERGVAIASASATASAGAPPRRARVARRTAHRYSVLKPVHERTQPSAPVNQSAAASPDVARATPPTAPAPSTSTAPRVGTSEASITPARHTSSPAGRGSSQASRATVSPTGESGALGPVQSPNG